MPPAGILQVNAAVRELAQDRQLGLMDWQLMLHQGWPRATALRDDMHPRDGFNHVAGNIILNALAVL